MNLRDEARQGHNDLAVAIDAWEDLAEKTERAFPATMLDISGEAAPMTSRQ